MSNGSGGTTTGTLTGARGFCASGNDAWGQPITLTSIYLEYLGNQIPANIYGLLAPVQGFNIVLYSITASAGTGGSITPSSLSVPSGGQVTLTITPSSGYQFSGLTVNGAQATATAGSSGTFTYTIPSVTENYTVQATFTQ